MKIPTQLLIELLDVLKAGAQNLDASTDQGSVEAGSLVELSSLLIGAAGAEPEVAGLFLNLVAELEKKP